MHRMTPNQAQAVGHEQYPIYVHCSTPSTKFRPFRSTIIVFEIFHILSFPIHKIFNFRQIAKISITLYTGMAPLFIIKFGSDWIKPLGVALEFPPIWACVNKISKCHRIFNYLANRQI